MIYATLFWINSICQKSFSHREEAPVYCAAQLIRLCVQAAGVHLVTNYLTTVNQAAGNYGDGSVYFKVATRKRAKGYPGIYKYGLVYHRGPEPEPVSTFHVSHVPIVPSASWCLM